MTFGQNLASIRKQKGLSQDDLAEKLSLSRQSIFAYESDLVSPSLTTVNEICKCLQVNISFLVNGTGICDLPKKLKTIKLDYIKKHNGELLFTELPNYFIELKDGEESVWAIYDNGIRDYSYHLSVQGKIIIHNEEGFLVRVDAYDNQLCKKANESFSLVVQVNDNKIRYIAKITKDKEIEELLTYKDKKFIKEWGFGKDNEGQSIIYNDAKEYKLTYNNKIIDVFLLTSHDNQHLYETFVDKNMHTLFWKRYDANLKSKIIIKNYGQSYGYSYCCVTSRLFML